MNRRAFFKHLSPFNQSKKSVHPPYLEDETLLEKVCIQCEAFCVLACDENIIKLNESKIPILDFSESGCTYCKACAESCKPKILKIDSKQNIKARIIILKKACLAWNKVICSGCEDACNDMAINFNQFWKPEINLEKCTTCGFCIPACPVKAIEAIPL